MKTSITVIAATLAYMVSLVACHHVGTSDQDTTTTTGLRGSAVPVGIMTNTIDANHNNLLLVKSNVHLSKDDRVQLAKTVKEALAKIPGADRFISVEDFSDLLNNLTNPAVLSAGLNLGAAALRSGGGGVGGGGVGGGDYGGGED